MKPRESQTCRVRKDRGNVILTALFVSIFLFFLSIALLWSNRQDIALSLSMEHKLKAQSEARSMAMEAYANLKEFGELRMTTERTSDNHVVSKLQLVSLPPFGDRGKVLLVQVRSTSGPVSCYMTLHLLETQFADNSYPNPVLFFPGSESDAGAVYGDFKYNLLNEPLEGELFANRGPIFKKFPSAAETRAVFVDNPPVFMEDGSIAYLGPAVITAPPLGEGQESTFQWLQFQNGRLEYKDIPAPDNLTGKPLEVDPKSTLVELTGFGNWTNASVRGVGPQLIRASWIDSKPAASDIDEIRPSLVESGGLGTEPLTDTRSSSGVQEWFIPTGAMTSQKSKLYTHAWHYLYKPFSGGAPEQVNALTAGIVTRWPCVLSYDTSSGTWSKEWAPLKESGDVTESRRPSQDVLMVADDGALYTVTENQPRHLLTLEESGKVEVGPTVHSGSLFVYNNAPYLVTDNGYQNLKDESVIKVSGLPKVLPGQDGPVLAAPEIGIIAIDEAGTNDLSPDGVLEINGTDYKTVMPEYLLSYTLASGTPAVAGKNIYTPINVSIDLSAGTEIKAGANGLFDEDYFEAYKPEGGTTLAHYDGERWHILPNGLRAFLERERHLPPKDQRTAADDESGNKIEAPPGSAQMVAASYAGLPANVNRYTIVSIDTRPFKFGLAE